MKGLKDFIYDKNDILIAILILAVAISVIVWRMDVIMDYPKTLAKETGTVETTEPEAPVSDPASSEASGSEPSPASSESDMWVNGALSHDITVTVTPGSATEAVQSLINAGLFSSYDEFSDICHAAGYTPENIKATTFTFSAGSTRTDIAKLVTN